MVGNEPSEPSKPSEPSVDERIKRFVDAAPPLTDEQCIRIAALLNTVRPDRKGATDESAGHSNR